MATSSEEWGQLRELFRGAIEQDPPMRAAYLDQVCADDASLRPELESLLASHDQAEYFIEAPAFAYPSKAVADASADGIVGRRLGSYQLIREIGRGGMGTVYLAERADEQYQKLVAIKIVRRGMDTDDILRRFRNERQILASLDHPNIARLLDGGTTDEGLPFLVMEYVEGTRVTDYCDAHQLPTNERLRIFRTICAAVQHAHQNLVVHRDLKPSNILITSDGTPKLLDFGIAKVLTADYAAGGSDHTGTELRVLTPDYASPEQVRGETLATTSDIYSLGVVLYELLTGRRPYRVTTPSPQEMARVVCEQMPTKPSESIAEFGSRIVDLKSKPNDKSKNDPRSVIRNPKILRGDLDNIVLKALRKEPPRRYESASQFSDDIQKYLDGLPVSARKDTFKYRSSKFVQRNRLGVAAAAIILLSLVGGIVATAWQARVAARQARAAALQAQMAQQEKAKAQSIIVLLEQMLNNANPSRSSASKHGKETTMAEMLDEASARLKSTEFANQPELKAELERIVGRAYYGQGLYSLAREHAQEYVLLEKGLYGENDPRTLEASTSWAMLLWERGEMTEAERLFRQALPPMRIGQKNGSITAETLLGSLNAFACLRRNQGDSREAEAAFREVLALGSQAPPDFDLGTTHSMLASTIADQGRFDEALQTARDAVTETRQREGAESSILGFTLTILGGFLSDKGNFAEADTALREAETIFRKQQQPSGLWVGDNLRNQAISFYRQNRFAEAQTKVDETLKIYLESFGVHYDNYPTALITKGLILNKTGKAKEGETILREAVKLRTESLPKDHFWVAVANDALGECLTTQKRFAEAEPLLVESYGVLNSRLGTRDPRTTEALGRPVALYELWGKPAQAEQYRFICHAVVT